MVQGWELGMQAGKTISPERWSVGAERGWVAEGGKEVREALRRRRGYIGQEETVILIIV